MIFFSVRNPNCRAMHMELTQPLTEVRNWDLPWVVGDRGRHVRLNRLPIKCGILDVSQPYRPARPVNFTSAQQRFQ
jgi:hypothetical protein